MKHIDKLFKEKLYHHEAQVPEGMWEKIAPITEEESGRAILWFWFAGILTLLLGGYGIYNLLGTNTADSSETNTLVQNTFESNQAEDLLVNNSLIAESNTLKETDNSTETKVTIPDSKKLQKNISSVSPSEKKQTKKATATVQSLENNNSISRYNSKASISNTVESISNAIGVPANLVITKSYINKEGSIIKQTNLTDESNNDGPTYDVILNSEAKELNAGALLRIIEPLENIPLPAFSKTLKKKKTNSIF